MKEQRKHRAGEWETVGKEQGKLATGAGETGGRSRDNRG